MTTPMTREMELTSFLQVPGDMTRKIPPGAINSHTAFEEICKFVSQHYRLEESGDWAGENG